MKSRSATVILALLLIASIPVFFFYLKPFLSRSSLFVNLATISEGKMWNVFCGQMMRIPHLFFAFIILALFGYRRRDVFLSRGDLSSASEEFKFFGIQDGEPWWKIGRNVGSVVIGVTAIFSFISLKPSLATIVDASRQIPLILLNASMNAFYEEFLFRAALIPPLLKVFGKSKTIWITAFLFGAAHLYGNQLSGILFALMAAYLGLLLAKSMIETKGIFFAWGLHCTLDFVIFFTMVMATKQ